MKNEKIKLSYKKVKMENEKRKMKKLFRFSFFVFTFSFSIIGCKQNIEKKDNGLQEIKLDEKTRNADIIRIPVTGESIDTAIAAKIKFEDTVYDFGTAKKGDQIKHIYKFQNIGKSPLLISDIRTTCGCTVPTWNKTPIEPNGKNELTINFNTEGKYDKQIKYITVVANTIPSETILTLTGMVTRKQE